MMRRWVWAGSSGLSRCWEAEACAGQGSQASWPAAHCLLCCATLELSLKGTESRPGNEAPRSDSQHTFTEGLPSVRHGTAIISEHDDGFVLGPHPQRAHSGARNHLLFCLQWVVRMEAIKGTMKKRRNRKSSDPVRAWGKAISRTDRGDTWK